MDQQLGVVERSHLDKAIRTDANISDFVLVKEKRLRDEDSWQTASSFSVKWGARSSSNRDETEVIYWARWLRRKAYGDLGKLIQGMLNSAESPVEVMNIPPAAFRNPGVNSGERT